MNPTLPGILPRGTAFTIHYTGRQLYDDTDPRGRAENIACALTLADYSLVLVAAPLLFYGVDELLRRLPPHCHILCLEADPGLYHLSPPGEKPLVPEDPRITVLHTDSPERVLETLRNLGEWRFRRCVLVSLNRAYALHASFYRGVQSSLQSALELYWKNRMTMINMAPLWIRNIFHNLPFFSRTRNMEGVSTDLPVFVAGAGESLEDLLPFLESEHDRLFLLAVDTALPVLLAYGLVPDAILCIESQVTNLSDFIGARGIHVPLFCDLLSHPDTLRVTGKEVYFFLSRFAPSRLQERMEQYGVMPLSIPPLGSVGVAGVFLALRITEKQVFFGGLDFSFTPGKTHSRGSPEQTRMLFSSSRLVSSDSYTRCMAYPGFMKPDKAGRSVKTTLILESYRTILSSVVGDSNRVFDLGRVGLPVPHTHRIDISGAAALLAKSDGRERFRKCAEPLQEGNPSAALAFLQNERRLLGDVLSLGNRLLSTDSSDNRLAFSTALDLCDYLLLHFPDPESRTRFNRPFTARLCASAGHYMAILDEIIMKDNGTITSLS